MKLSIEKLNIKDVKSNEVTSPLIFTPRKVRDKNGNLQFHPEGIFSKKIFGQYGHCDCDDSVEEDNDKNYKVPRKGKRYGYCSKCGVRVLSPKESPDFYIKFNNVDIPRQYIDYSPYSKLKKNLSKLFNYEAFIYDGKVYDFNAEDTSLLDFENVEKDDILIGRDAILSLGVDEAWYNEQVTNKLFIPHPSFRPITTLKDDKHFIGSLNESLVNILKKKEILTKFLAQNNDPFIVLSIKNEIVNSVKNVYSEVYNLLSRKKRSIISNEIRGQSLTGAVRGVITNNFSLDEDTIIIGKYFIKTLYPELYLKFCRKDDTGKKDSEGYPIWEYNSDEIDIKALNKELEENAYYVLVNRPPTIGEKSILAMKPVFSLKEEEKYVLQINPMITDGLAGDFDGDCALVIALYSRAANKEVEKLLPSKNFISGETNNIRNGLPEDFVYVMQKSYEDKNSEEIETLINEKELVNE